MISSRYDIEKRQRLHAFALFGVQITAVFWIGYEIAFGQIEILELSLFFVCLVVNLVGVEIGLHRYFCHQAFAAKPPLKMFLAIASLSAAQGPILYWVANHRLHHARSDRAGDLHSPHHGAIKNAGLFRRWWHAHQGWTVSHQLTDTVKYARDLYADQLLLKLNRRYSLIVLASIVVPGVFLGIIEGSIAGFVSGFFWGGVVRLSVALNITFATNSICHLFGNRRFDTPDQSRNNLYLNCISLGGGLHNNHHAHPNLASCSFRWWEIDAYGWLISLFEKLGLASNVRVKRGNG